ncbi:hypothetical protein D9Q98_007392 [Chlorella vulgaris]|uniref:PHD-type domain-containing protein n=1 Tax=Chlorella vulgaris TaxID=3077 RepID=A0A9D4TM08_CHLVU|nr:hypothetical protein D9Q98_007392 [Chlorella vulgaris]
MPPRRKSALEELIRIGFVADGELLRYKSKQGQLLAVGRAREGGIEVEGVSKLLGYTAFEEVSGSRYHRPAEHTHTSSGRSLQSLSLLAGGSSSGAKGKAAPPPEPAVELLEDDNDEFCHICGLGGDLVCCETCPAVFHAACLDLPAAPEGDFYCPLCTCGTCGKGGYEGRMPTGCEWIDCSNFVSPQELQQSGRPQLADEPRGGGTAIPVAAAVAASPPPAAVVKPEPAKAAETGAAAAEAVQEASGVAPMQVDAQPAAAAPPTANFERLAAAASSSPPLAPAPADAAVDVAGAAMAADSAAVQCPVTGCWHHLSCFPASFAQQLRQGASGTCIRSQADAASSRRLAALCSAGVLSLNGPAHTATPAAASPGGESAVAAGGDSGSSGGAGVQLSLLVVRGAAAASPHYCRGHAPAYTPEQRQHLKVALSAGMHVLHSCYAPLPDSRTGEDMLPWLLRGAVFAGGKADYSSMHTVLLYAGQAVVGTAVFRSFGEVAEIPVLAVRPEVQRHNGLGRLLLAAVEQLLLLAGAKRVFMPAFAAEGSPYIHAHMAPGPAPAAQPAGDGAAGASDQLAVQQAAQPLAQLPPPLQAKWGYCLAPPAEVLALTIHPFLRIPGVLLACKQLGPDSVLPPPGLPERLCWSGRPGLDPKQLLKDGWLATVASPLLGGASAAATTAAGRQQQEGSIQGATRGGTGVAAAQAAAAGAPVKRKPGRPPKVAAAVRDTFKEEEVPPCPEPMLQTAAAAAGPGDAPLPQQQQYEQQRQQQYEAAMGAAAGAPPLLLDQQQQQQPQVPGGGAGFGMSPLLLDQQQQMVAALMYQQQAWQAAIQQHQQQAPMTPQQQAFVQQQLAVMAAQQQHLANLPPDAFAELAAQQQAAVQQQQEAQQQHMAALLAQQQAQHTGSVMQQQQEQHQQ